MIARVMSEVLRVVRWRRWAGSKLPLLLSAYVLALLSHEVAIGSALTGAIQLSLHILGYASFGYVANSYSDIREDERAGKGSVFSGWSSRSSSAAVGVSVLAALLPLIVPPIERTDAVFWGVASIAAAAAYSLRPIRLKERGALGVAGSSLAQRTLPTLTIFSYFGALTWSLVLFAAVTFAIGVRFILVHQADDLTSDRITGTRTFATRIGLQRVEDVIVRLILPIEALGVSVWLLVAQASLGALAALLVVYVGAQLVLLVLLARMTRFPLAGYAPLGELYSTYLPVGLSMTGVLFGDRTLLPAYLGALLLAITLLPSSLIEEYHRMRRLLRARRKNSVRIGRDRMVDAGKAGVAALGSMQSGDGSFELVKWTKGGTATHAHHLFASASVLIAAGRLMPLESVRRAVEAIDAVQDVRGTWNFDPSLGIPNDADSTSCALLAREVAGVRVDEHHLELLRAQWRPERGRFATWYSEEPSWCSSDRDDPVVNLNVMALLQCAEPPASDDERDGVTRYVATVPPTSRYYCDPMAIPYAAFKAGVSIDRTRHRAWGRPGSRSTSISIAHWLTITETHDDSLVALLLSRQRADGSWPAEPWFTGVNVPFWGSQAVTTAYCVEALHAVQSRLIRSR